MISQGLGDINNLVEVVPGQCRFGRLYIMMYSVYIYKYIVWICMCIYIYIYIYIYTHIDSAAFLHACTCKYVG